MYAVCREHLAVAIDEFIEIYTTAPDVYQLGQISFTDWAPPAHCAFCGQAPEYLVV